MKIRKIKNIVKLKIIVVIQGNIVVLRTASKSVPKKIPISVHNGSNDYHFIIKELVEEVEKQFTCLGEKTEKYITIAVKIEKKSYKN